MNTIPGKKSLFIPSYLGVLYISTSQLNTKPGSKIIEPSGRKIEDSPSILVMHCGGKSIGQVPLLNLRNQIGSSFLEI
jgi:hypothetical protein